MPNIAEFDGSESEVFDLFIAVLGFEDRALTMPRALAEAGTTAKRTVLCTYTTNPDDNNRNSELMRETLFAISTSTPHVLEANASFTIGLRSALDPLPERARIVWDLSVASNQLIIQTLRVLLDLDIDLQVVYAEAETYHPTQEEFKANAQRWTADDQVGLEKGVLDVQVASEYPGNHDSQISELLILFPGFSRDRLRASISRMQPQWIDDLAAASLVWMVGRPHLDADHWRQEALQEIHQIPEHQKQHTVSTFDYKDTLGALENEYASYGLERNITVSALGSKMQAFGTALYCFARPDVRVMFAQPQEYNAGKYSLGAKAKWRIPIGSTTDLSARLRRVGTINLQDQNADVDASA